MIWSIKARLTRIGGQIRLLSIMQTSGRKLNQTIERQIYKMLHQMFADVRNPEEVNELLSDLLTSTESISMAKRLGIAVYLDKGRSYEDIKNHLKVSSATIATVAEQMGNPGIQRALRYIKAEEWADDWSKRIGRTLGKIFA